MTKEAYSHEVSSVGYWPGGGASGAFYSYMAPTPEAFKDARVGPEAAYFDTQLGEFLLKYSDVRTAQSPDQAILDFCESAYEAGAKLAHWDRASLERAAE